LIGIAGSFAQTLTLGGTPLLALYQRLGTTKAPACAGAFFGYENGC
jgi:hypothetical protein